jgi:hypothetical protein
MGWWYEYRTTLKDRDYWRWRRRRRLVRVGLVILTMILLSPLLVLLKLFDVRSFLSFACVLVSVLVLLAIYRLLGWIGRGYTPPLVPASRSDTRETSPFASFGIPSQPTFETPAATTPWSTEPMAKGSAAAAAWTVTSAAAPVVAEVVPLGPPSPAGVMRASSPPTAGSGCGVLAVVAVVGLLVLLLCGGLLSLVGWRYWSGWSAPGPRGVPVREPPPLPRPLGPHDRLLDRLQRENQQRMEQMQRDAERRMQEMQQRQREMQERMRRSRESP